ncbi:hypothetical protein [Priestia filamentosa]|uniref:hypothetical protein n=1 Tax=Priestia filamentosa TaxID=1402861 RepID=UPI0009ED0733|nr:hypothetical protein [Priestia filamentosa]
MKKLNIKQTVNRLVPYDSQYLTIPEEIVELMVLDILSSRQALVHYIELYLTTAYPRP